MELEMAEPNRSLLASVGISAAKAAYVSLVAFGLVLFISLLVNGTSGFLHHT